MRKYKVLTTGIGTIIGYGEIQSLRNSNFDVEIFGMDVNPECVGRFWCDHFIVAKPASDNRFPEFLIDTVKYYSIDLVLLGTEQEMHRIIAERKTLESIWDKLAVNAASVYAVSEDKWDTYQFLTKNGLLAIPSMLLSDYESLVANLGSPLLVKPRRSFSSRGIALIKNKDAFETSKTLLGDMFMAQKYIGDKDHEYTTAVFGFGDGSCTSPIIMRRQLSFEGATLNAEVVEISEIEDQIRTIAKLIRPIGPTNLQFRKDGNQYYLLEINPRISASTSIRAAFGYNESEMAIDYYVNGNRGLLPKIRKGKAYRYIADYIAYD